MRHREAWAVEKRAPATPAAATPSPAPTPKPAAAKPSAPAVTRRVAGAAANPAPSAPSAPTLSDAELERDILIVASKLKKYIRARSGMNTSDSVMDPLSDYVRSLCDKAIRVAGTDGRKTVMDRDIRAAGRS